MDDFYYKQLISLLLFPDRNHENMSKYFSVSNQFLWRRDSQHLVAFHLGNKTGEWDYFIDESADFSSISDIDVSEKGVLTFAAKDEDCSISLTPCEKTLFPNSLQTLFQKNHHSEFEMKGKELSRILSIFQRKISGSPHKPEDVSVVLDLKRKTLSLKELNESKPIGLKMLKGEENIISYSFVLFRDLLINSNKFDEKILFKASMPYFTAIRYDKRLYSVLTHKKD